MPSPIDLNADIGEGADDEALLPFITRANIACGGHAGDDDSMQRTVAACRRHGVALIGAHPSYPDREHFGRRSLVITDGGLLDALRAQIEALQRVAGALSHVKPHGALYHDACSDARIARIVLEAARDLPVVLLAGCQTASIFPRLLGEAFADRRYEGGALVPRSRPDALIVDPSEAASQALRLRGDPAVVTLCVHSDAPGAPALAHAVRDALAARLR